MLQFQRLRRLPVRLGSSIQHKSCADGSYMKEYELSKPLTKGFFEYLKFFGQVSGVVGLGDGYYNFEKKDWFSIKGFVGDTTVEVRFKRETMDVTAGFLRMLFSGYKENGSSDIAGLRESERAKEAQIRRILG